MTELSELIEDVKEFEMGMYPMFTRDETERKKKRISELEA